ncbi:ABC transporter permease [Peribacillus sp. FSL H8-0477]|uniref:ABC transporter permease n=1 Tax=Peribacillus sp. FSL H8-0477 TaxID=2921388 RepID=UPI0030F758D5
MQSLHIAWNDVKIRMADRSALIMLLLLPLVLTAILGTALKPIMSNEDSFADTTIGLYTADNDSLAKDFEEVLRKLDFIKIKTTNKEENLGKMLMDGKIDVGLSIPAAWSENVKKGTLKEVWLFSSSEKNLKASVIESILTSFVSRVQSVSHTTNIVMSDLSTSQAIAAEPGEVTELASTLPVELTNQGNEVTPITDWTIGKETVSTMQYYAAAMAAMFLLYNIPTGAKSFMKERELGTLSRLKASPTSDWSIILGKFLGTLGFACIQFLLFIFGTSLFCKVHWGDNIGQLLAMGGAYAVAVSGLSMLVAGLIKEMRTADLISGIGIQILAFAGGSMLPLSQFPDILKRFSDMVPNKWALSGFLDIMAGVNWVEILPAIIGLFLVGIAAMLIGTLRLRTR